MYKKIGIISLILVIVIISIVYAGTVTDYVLIQPNGDGITFTIKNAAGARLLSFDTSTGELVLIGSLSASGDLTVSGDMSVSGEVGAVDFSGTIKAGSGFWDNAPSRASNDMTQAFFYENDFVGEVCLPTATGVANGWKATGDATYDVLSAAGTLGGWCLLAPEGGSNNEVYFQMGQLGTETYVECTSSSGKEWWLEFNLTPSSVTNAANWFVGLAEEGCAVGDFINDSGADIADKDAILMGVFEGDPNNLIGIWQTAGAAFDTALAAQAITAVNMTLGMHFDGATSLEFYYNGTLVATQSITATGFPDTEELSPIIAMKQGATAININLDWIKLVAER